MPYFRFRQLRSTKIKVMNNKVIQVIATLCASKTTNRKIFHFAFNGSFTAFKILKRPLLEHMSFCRLLDGVVVKRISNRMLMNLTVF